MTAPEPCHNPILEICELIKSYPGLDGSLVPVLDIPSLVLQSGDHIGLRGASGFGKTTLLHCIAGIVRPDSGQILVQGHDMAQLPQARQDQLRAKSIGYVFQTFNLLQGYTALENVSLAVDLGGGGQARAKAEHLLERVGLKDRLHYEPHRLSIGQQQRVAIARALVKRPALVLADEPTGNLDPHRASEALSLLRTIATEEGSALLLVSHDPAILSQMPTVLDLHTLNRAVAQQSMGAVA